MDIGKEEIMYKKHLNYLLARHQFERRDEYLFSYPYHAFIDPSTACNLSCPFCPTGNREMKNPRVNLKFENFKKLLDEIGDYLIVCELFQYGEPFLNPDIFRMLRYAKNFHIYTRISTNFNLFSEEMARETVESGLDEIILSIDGASQETYSKYRVGGDFDRVMEHLRMLDAAKKARGSRTPEIVWQFLVFRHNEHEIEKARALAKEYGADVFYLQTGNAKSYEESGQFWASDEVLERYGLQKKEDLLPKKDQSFQVCQWPWTHLIISAEGAVCPCCRKQALKGEIGDAYAVPFKELWNNEAFRSIRRYFATGERQEPPNVCERCGLGNRQFIVPLKCNYRNPFIKEDGVSEGAGLSPGVCELSAELSSVYNSSSWKMTRPLRLLSGKLKGLKDIK